jgi:hypothetical protein
MHLTAWGILAWAFAPFLAGGGPVLDKLQFRHSASLGWRGGEVAMHKTAETIN